MNPTELTEIICALGLNTNLNMQHSVLHIYKKVNPTELTEIICALGLNTNLNMQHSVLHIYKKYVLVWWYNDTRY